MFFFFDFENYSISDLIDRMKSIKPIKEIVEETGISQPIISQWKARNSFPKCDDLYKIACCLNVSMEWLLTGEDKVNNLSGNEATLLENYRSLDDAAKKHVELIVEALAGK